MRLKGKPVCVHFAVKLIDQFLMTFPVSSIPYADLPPSLNVFYLPFLFNFTFYICCCCFFPIPGWLFPAILKAIRWLPFSGRSGLMRGVADVPMLLPYREPSVSAKAKASPKSPQQGAPCSGRRGRTMTANASYVTAALERMFRCLHA